LIALGKHWPSDVLGGGTLGPDGAFDFTVGGSGDLFLAWQDPALTRKVRWAVSIGEDAEQRLDLSIPSSGLRGRVVDPSGAPVAGARIQIVGAPGSQLPWLWDDDPTLESGVDGSFEFGALFPGVYTLSTGGEASGAADGWARLVLGGLEVVPDQVLDNVELRLAPARSVSGLVRTSDGLAVAGAIVYARDEAGRMLDAHSGWFGTFSDELGRFEYGGLGPGKYTLSARTRRLVAGDSAPVTVTEGVEARTEIVLHPGTTLHVSIEGGLVSRILPVFSIRDGAGREYAGIIGPVEAQRVYSGELLAETQRFGPLAAGTYVVRATTLGGLTESHAVTLGGEPERDVVLRLGD
jgi:hypothetical protein